jgi:hypothetical protein
MKAILLTITALLVSFGVSKVQIEDKEFTQIEFIDQPDTSEFDQKKALAELRKQINGWEKEPSEEIYENIQTLNKVPAGKLLAIMEFGYAKSLGVTCTHCHDPNNWSSDEKAEKIITREMSKMVNEINSNILANIGALGDRTAIVNCTTCHRGQIKPALNLDDN